MSTLTTVEVLRGAKAVLERNGWHQGGLYNAAQAHAGSPAGMCRVCLVGALCVAATGDPVGRNDETDAAWGVLSDALGPYGDVATWNDQEERTLDEVYALLDEAIKRAEAGDPR